MLGNLGVGKVFGELAILYNCKRTASIRAVVDSKVWALERRVFQQVMVSSGLRRMVHQMNFLKSVPLLSQLPPNILTKLGDVLETEQFTGGDYIIREGTVGDTFYILARGEVRVTKRQEGGSEKLIRDMTEGDYFGEMVGKLSTRDQSSQSPVQALMKTELRTANVIALTGSVECLALDRE